MRRRDILLQGAASAVRGCARPLARAPRNATPFDGATVRNLARDLAQHA